MAKLYMLLIGCTPPGRNIEQHDIFFGIGETIKDLMPEVKAFWPEAPKIHVDAWREVTHVDGFSVNVIEGHRSESESKLFFLNLGGYKAGEFEEFHYKMIVAAPDFAKAIQKAKQTAFFRHTKFDSANSHIDDKYGVDVDDVYEIKDILPASAKSKYSIVLEPAPPGLFEDELHIGYFKLDKVDDWG